jgi:hypothetical protein
MTQLSTGALWSSFRLVLELENRSQQIEAAVAQLKSALADPATISLPDTVGIADELRWQLDNSLRQLTELEAAVGVQRRSRKPKAEPRVKKAAVYSLRGSTRSVSLPDLIGLLSAQRKTGSLWIKAGSERFILELLDGAIVHAMSNAPRPSSARLGTVLVARNKLSTEKLEEFLQRYCPQDGRIGEVMKRTQLVSEDDLRDALEWQVRELFHRISSVDDAVFSFREGAISKLELRVCLNTTQLLLESAQALDEKAWEQQARAALGKGHDLERDDEPDPERDDERDPDAEAHAGEQATCAGAPPATAGDSVAAGDGTPETGVAKVEADHGVAERSERRAHVRRRSKRRRRRS